jgi:tetratricopeptide (TPR) repeat protein
VSKTEGFAINSGPSAHAARQVARVSKTEGVPVRRASLAAPAARALTLFGLLALGHPAAAEAPGTSQASEDATFRRGNDHYFHGQYQEAVEAYEQVAAQGVLSDDLFYNLGNAYLKAGGLGQAIYNYERALELDPSQEDARYNLQTARDAARKKAEDRLVGAEGVPWWTRAIQPFSVGSFGWTFLSLYVSLFALLIVLHFVQPGFLRAALWSLFAFVVTGAAITGAMLGGRLYLAERVTQAVVLADSIQVKEGPDPNYQTVFAVHAGLKVRITEKEQDWVRVRLSNGLEGWVRERELGRL